MYWKFKIKPEYLYAKDWMEFELRWPEAARWLSLCSLRKELRKTEGLLRALENSDEPTESLRQRKAELIARMAQHAASNDRWDSRFL
jgi:hypothetical protein